MSMSDWGIEHWQAHYASCGQCNCSASRSEAITHMNQLQARVAQTQRHDTLQAQAQYEQLLALAQNDAQRAAVLSQFETVPFERVEKPPVLTLSGLWRRIMALDKADEARRYPQPEPADETHDEQRDESKELVGV